MSIVHKDLLDGASSFSPTKSPLCSWVTPSSGFGITLNMQVGGVPFAEEQNLLYNTGGCDRRSCALSPCSASGDSEGWQTVLPSAQLGQRKIDMCAWRGIHTGEGSELGSGSRQRMQGSLRSEEPVRREMAMLDGSPDMQWVEIQHPDSQGPCSGAPDLI